MVVATHKMRFARQVADKVCFLDGGAVLERGGSEHMFTAPVHARTQQFLQRSGARKCQRRRRCARTT